MERRSNKQSDHFMTSMEVIEKRIKMRNHMNMTGSKWDQFGSSNRLDFLEFHGEKDDEDDEIEPEEGLLRKGMKKGQALKLNLNAQEDEFFEESNLEVAEKPMITFNHVCSVTESEQISFEAIKNSGSRSPSPLLEVPSFKIGNKQAVRPPL